MMRWIIAVTLLVGICTSLPAHHPDRARKPVYPRCDLIGPLGNRLPPGYRRVYNRPSYWEGKIAYCIAPSSQEAMAWHDAAHRNAYKNHRPRIEMHYFYPKPWEVLPIGARVATEPDDGEDYDIAETLSEINQDDTVDAPEPVEPLVEEQEMIE